MAKEIGPEFGNPSSDQFTFVGNDAPGFNFKDVGGHSGLQEDKDFNVTYSSSCCGANGFIMKHFLESAVGKFDVFCVTD